MAFGVDENEVDDSAMMASLAAQFDAGAAQEEPSGDSGDEGRGQEAAEADAPVDAPEEPEGSSELEAEETEADELEADDGGDEPDGGVGGREYHDAMAALYRFGYDEDELDSMTREQVVRLGKKTLKQQRFVDQLKDENRAFRRKEQAAKNPAEEHTAEETAPSAVDPSALEAAARPLADALGIGSDPAGSKILTDAIGAVVQAQMAPLVAALKQAQQKAAAGYEASHGMLISNVRRGLVERFPTVSDDDVFAALHSDAELLIASDRFAELPPQERAARAYEAAARMHELPTKTKSTARQEEGSGRPRKVRARRSSSSRRTPGGQGKKKAMTRDEVETERGRLVVVEKISPQEAIRRVPMPAQ